MPSTCSTCSEVNELPYYGATCSKECARIARLNNSLLGLEHSLREMMLNLGGVR